MFLVGLNTGPPAHSQRVILKFPTCRAEMEDRHKICPKPKKSSFSSPHFQGPPRWPQFHEFGAVITFVRIMRKGWSVAERSTNTAGPFTSPTSTVFAACHKTLTTLGRPL